MSGKGEKVGTGNEPQVSGGARAESKPQVDGGPQPLATDIVFKTLSNQRRRYVLHYLKQRAREQPVTIRTLSEQIAAWENRIDSADVNPKQRKRIYTALHQTHLPKMDKLGIIEYDRNRGTVSLVDSIDQFDIYFDMRRTTDMPWSHLYLGLGSIASALVVCGFLSVWPFSLVGGYLYALLFAGSLVAVGGYHTYRERASYLGASDTPPELEIQLSDATATVERPDAEPEK